MRISGKATLQSIAVYVSADRQLDVSYEAEQAFLPVSIAHTQPSLVLDV